MEGVRWAFSFAAWKPKKNEWIKAIQCIQNEEKIRISRFVYAKDAKASLVGRLLIRKLFVDKFGISNDCLKLGRNDKEKPFIINELPPEIAPALSFNISHQGSFTVMAAECNRPVGVDVMKIEYSGGKSISDFFKTMDRQFTDEEWQRILAGANEKEQLTNFCRFWCLKESYVKSIGVGISFNLKRLNFVIKTPVLQSDKVTKDTQLKVDNSWATNWEFHETMLDTEHCVAVALGPATKMKCESNTSAKDIIFRILNFDELIETLISIYPEDIEDWEEFKQKPEYPQ